MEGFFMSAIAAYPDYSSSINHVPAVPETYNYRVVRQFAIMTVVWRIHRRRIDLA
jgi:cbb3-type cytochrome oxidase subunit 1